MTDIVERLRASCDVREASLLRNLAADEIERLRAFISKAMRDVWTAPREVLAAHLAAALNDDHSPGESHTLQSQQDSAECSVTDAEGAVQFAGSFTSGEQPETMNAPQPTAALAAVDKRMKELWQTISPVPTAQPGSYNRGYDNGTADTLRAIRAEIDKAHATPPAQPIAAPGIDECMDEIAKLIKPGELPGTGWDKTAERNGLVLAYNTLSSMKCAMGRARATDPTAVVASATPKWSDHAEDCIHHFGQRDGMDRWWMHDCTCRAADPQEGALQSNATDTPGEDDPPRGIVLNLKAPHAKDGDVPRILEYLLSVLPAGSVRDAIKAALKAVEAALK